MPWIIGSAVTLLQDAGGEAVPALDARVVLVPGRSVVVVGAVSIQHIGPEWLTAGHPKK